MITKETYLEEVEAQLRVWGERIAQLKTKVQAKTETAYQEQLNELAQRRAEVEQKLQVLKQASDDKWEDFKSAVDQSLTALEESFDRTKEKVAQVGWLGWTQGMTEKRKFDSEGWVEGLGQRTGHSEGWAEGMGEQTEDSKGWVEGMKTR